MRRFGKIIGRILLVLLLVVAVLGVWKKEQLARLMAVNSLFSPEKIVHNFSHMDEAFLTAPMTRGEGTPSALPVGAPMELPATIAPWVEARTVTALMVMKDGAIRHESYYHGTDAQDRRISWSVAKSFLSALFGVLLEDGTIASIDEQVVKYVPSLKGTAYDGATIKNVLQMSSGVKFDEDYLDFWSDINKMGRVIALGQSMDGFTEGLHENGATPGDHWNYVSIDTHVIGMVIRGATGRTITDLLQEKIIHKMGFEGDPYYVADGYETAFVLGGLNLRTRDYARFGQMFLQDGKWQGEQVVPASWIAASTAPSARTAPGTTQYGYQWWMAADSEPGEYFARGIYGQYIYINKRLGAVVTVNSADRGFREEGSFASNLAAFRALAEAAQ